MEEKEVSRRTRITAVVFIIIVALALTTLAYGFVQKGIADETRKALIEKEESLQKCESAARQQMIDAQNAANQMHLELEKLKSKK